jgi:7 transmembrane receptor (rhodopsin family)
MNIISETVSFHQRDFKEKSFLFQLAKDNYMQINFTSLLNNAIPLNLLFHHVNDIFLPSRKFEKFLLVHICIHIGMEYCERVSTFLIHGGYIVVERYSKTCIPSKPLESSKQTTINLENVFIAGYFPLQSEHCLVWICLDVLFCTASIMHLCTISIDRYLSLRYPMRFGRNKTRKRVVLKIFFVWLLSIAMSLPLSLMYSKVNFNLKAFLPLKSQLIPLGSRFSAC